MLAGCASSTATLVSYRDPFFPETVEIRFDECVYRREPQGDCRIIAVAARPPESGPAAPIRQYLDMRLFWEPYPGKTPVASTSMDALVRYVLDGGHGAVTSLSGTGFLKVDEDRWSDELHVELRRSLVTPEGAGEASPFGESRITGIFTARRDAARTVELLREIDLRMGTAPPDAPSGD